MSKRSRTCVKTQVASHLDPDPRSQHGGQPSRQPQLCLPPSLEWTLPFSARATGGKTETQGASSNLPPGHDTGKQGPQDPDSNGQDLQSPSLHLFPCTRLWKMPLDERDPSLGSNPHCPLGAHSCTPDSAHAGQPSGQCRLSLTVGTKVSR